MFASTGTALEHGEWFNSFVFETDAVPANGVTRTLCRQLITAMHALHPPHVKQERVLVVNYRAPETSPIGHSVFCLPAHPNIQSAPRPAGESPLPELCLQLNKQTMTGRHGRVWLPHALTSNDVVLGGRGNYVLTTATAFQALIDFELVDGLSGFPDFQLVVPPTANMLIPSTNYRDASFTLGHPVRAKTRYMARMKVRGERMGYFAEIGALNKIITGSFIQVEAFYDNGLDLTPFSVKQQLLDCLGILVGEANKIQHFAEGDASNQDDETSRPFSMWGRAADELGNVAHGIKEWAENEQERISKLPDTSITVGGDKYWTHHDTQEWKDSLEICAHNIANLLDFDYQTRYSENASGRTIDGRDINQD